MFEFSNYENSGSLDDEDIFEKDPFDRDPFCEEDKSSHRAQDTIVRFFESMSELENTLLEMGYIPAENQTYKKDYAFVRRYRYKCFHGYVPAYYISGDPYTANIFAVCPECAR